MKFPVCRRIFDIYSQELLTIKDLIMCRPNSSELQKNLQSASTWNFTHMIRCVESRDKGLRDNNNITIIKKTKVICNVPKHPFYTGSNFTH